MFQVSPWQFVFHTRTRNDVTREYLTTNTNKSVEAEPSISPLVTRLIARSLWNFTTFIILFKNQSFHLFCSTLSFIRKFFQNLFFWKLYDLHSTFSFSILNHFYSSNELSNKIFISFVWKSAEKENGDCGITILHTFSLQFLPIM